MLAGSLFQLFFAIAFVVIVCFISYKMTISLALKVFDLILESSRFRMGICFFLAVIFFAVGVVQLNDFMEGLGLSLSQFFPLSFLITGIFVFLGSKKQSPTK